MAAQPPALAAAPTGRVVRGRATALIGQRTAGLRGIRVSRNANYSRVGLLAPADSGALLCSPEKLDAGLRFATFPITRARSAGRSHSGLATSTQRPSYRRSSARPGVACCPPNSFRGSTWIADRRPLSRPSSGQGGGGGCSRARGAFALPTSPAAGLRPVGASWLGRRRYSLDHEIDLWKSAGRRENHGRAWR
jgi:hypothetical protein